MTHCLACQHDSGDRSWGKWAKPHPYRPQALGVVGPHYNQRVNQAGGDPLTTNSQVTRLHKKLEVMPVDLCQSGTRNRAQVTSLPLPNSDESQFGRIGQFHPLLEQFLSNLANGVLRTRIRLCTEIDMRPLTMDRLDLIIPDSRKLSFRHSVSEKNDTSGRAIVGSIKNHDRFLRNRMSGGGLRFITTYHHHLLQIDDSFHPSLLQSRQGVISGERVVHRKHHRRERWTLDAR